MFRKDPLLNKSGAYHSPHNIIPQLIKEHSTLLDIGCNTGYLGETLKTKHVTTDGIDINDKALALAKKHCRKVYKRDLYAGKLNIPKARYDYIVFADVLEHLPRPDLLLTDCLKYLKPKGHVIASLPNTARIDIRLLLLLGKFDYTYGGILSEDHLRFFTKKSGAQLFEKVGYKVKKIIPTGLGYRLKIFQTLTACQFIYVCTKK